MLFNSFPFIYLLLITFGLYYLPVSRRLQVHLLVAASFVFYSWSNPYLLLLLLFSITINAYTSYQVYYGQAGRKKFNATLGVVINLASLAFFKYSPLFSRMLFSPENSIGSFLLNIPLPIGISFFTFHGISMLVDLYRGKNIKADTEFIPKLFTQHWLYTSLYIAFFPQLVAGPITKSYNFMPQIGEKSFADIKWEQAFKHLIMGYFLKMVIADNIKDQTFWVAYPYFEGQTSWTLITMLFGYSIQIFADFAGYSLIALGLAELFGYNLPVNFNFPYIAASFSEFWTRWHISLSSWLREYLYFSLGGNKKGNIRTYINLMIVMFLGGLWHGAAWSYAVWGSFHGLALAVERFFNDKFGTRTSPLWMTFHRFKVFIFVTFAWLLFKLPNFGQAVLYLHDMFTHWHTGAPSPAISLNILIYAAPVVIYHLYYLHKEKTGRQLPAGLQPAFYGFLLFAIFVNSGTAGEFIYFQF